MKTQEQKNNIRFWLKLKMIHWLVNWNAGLDCFGNKVGSLPN